MQHNGIDRAKQDNLEDQLEEDHFQVRTIHIQLRNVPPLQVHADSPFQASQDT